MSAIWKSANWTRQFGIRQTGNRQFGMLPSKYHHAPKQAWQTGVLIQCRYGLSGAILFIFLIILNIWIYNTITFCRFTFCFYILMAKQTNRGKRSVFNEIHLQKICFRKLKNYEIMWKRKERTSEQCHEFVKFLK